jgi:hypothetical protein
VQPATGFPSRYFSVKYLTRTHVETRHHMKNKQADNRLIVSSSPSVRVCVVQTLKSAGSHKETCLIIKLRGFMLQTDINFRRYAYSQQFFVGVTLNKCGLWDYMPHALTAR